MKTDFQPIKKTSPAEVLMTLFVLALVTAMLLAGSYLVGFIQLPKVALAYVGGILLSFVVMGSFLIIHNCVKFMLKKEVK